MLGCLRGLDVECAQSECFQFGSKLTGVDGIALRFGLAVSQWHGLALDQVWLYIAACGRLTCASIVTTAAIVGISELKVNSARGRGTRCANVFSRYGGRMQVTSLHETGWAGVPLHLRRLRCLL